MNRDDLMKKGLAQEKLGEIKQLILRIDNATKTINQNLWFYDGVESLEEQAALAELKQLIKNKQRYLVLKREIENLDSSIYVPRSPAEV